MMIIATIWYWKLATMNPGYHLPNAKLITPPAQSTDR